jgi:hypothetical protein
MSIEDRLKHGRLTILNQDMFKTCPFRIMMPEHYRADGTCKCNEREHAIMEEWGYKWDANEHKWIGDEDKL